MDVTTVGDDFAVLHDGGQPIRIGDLSPDTEYQSHGVEYRTLARPDGELLCRFATVNDVHLGEEECGIIEGLDAGPIFRTALGQTPYPVVMNRGAVSEIVAIDPIAVIAKGDLTGDGAPEEYQTFLDLYEPVFGPRLHHVRGNHDAYHGQTFALGPIRVDLPGVTLAVLDTVIPYETAGQISADQLAWLDDLCGSADRPVLCFGHHNLWLPASQRTATYFGLNPDDSEKLLALVERRARFCGYFAGHTHRNRVRHYSPTGSVPYAEVACVKDFPGSWAEYRVYEGGVVQLHHRISAPDALAWSEQCRGTYGNVLDYSSYALGKLRDRCFVINTNR